MDAQQLAAVLNTPATVENWLRPLRILDVAGAQESLHRLRKIGLPDDLLAFVLTELEAGLPLLVDPDLALNTLARYFEASRNPLSTGSLFERDPEELQTLLRLFAASARLGNVLVQDPAAFQLVRLTDGQPVERDRLVAEIRAEITKVTGRRAVVSALRRTKQRELLRIAFGDVIGHQPVDIVTQQLSHLADALCEAAINSAAQRLRGKHGIPRAPDGTEARFVVLGFGKLGGAELSYAAKLELMVLFDHDGSTDGPKRLANAEFFDRLSTDMAELLHHSPRTRETRENAMTLDEQNSTDGNGTHPDGTGTAGSEPSESIHSHSSDKSITGVDSASTGVLGQGFEIDMKLGAGSGESRRAQRLDSALRHFDLLGQTWERQAFIKARPIAGDIALGQNFLRAMEPWVYRRYLTRTDIVGIKALKRRIERRAQRLDPDSQDFEAGRGGISDVEFVIPFLQLINGSDIPDLRVGNTLTAIKRLHASKCLDDTECHQLLAGYSFLRRLEHRVQISNNPVTTQFDSIEGAAKHGPQPSAKLPIDEAQLGRLAVSLGDESQDKQTAKAAFERDLNKHLTANRAILDHLLDDVLADSFEPEPDAEFDLILDPAPQDDWVNEILAPYGFEDARQAYQNLLALSEEKIRFLSTRRCRHSLASIAKPLLEQVSRTADPDNALNNLCRVSDSLGGKGVLWELFRVHPPSLQLYVQLCATSNYLATILVSNPGMLDELMDSLVLNQLPTRELLTAMLADWCRGPGDLNSQLQSFKSVQHLNAGVRDILGKQTIRDTTAFLADVAQVCLARVCAEQFSELTGRFGTPWHKTEDRPCEMIVVGLGKLGGREPNYHSDLDVLFLYECEGTTRRLPSSHDGSSRITTPSSTTAASTDTTTHQHFFSQLAQRITKAVNQLGPKGRLYELDTKQRTSGQLAICLESFEKQLMEPNRPVTDHLALCRARTVYGSPAAEAATTAAIQRIIGHRIWNSDSATAVRGTPISTGNRCRSPQPQARTRWIGRHRNLGSEHAAPIRRQAS